MKHTLKSTLVFAVVMVLTIFNFTTENDGWISDLKLDGLIAKSYAQTESTSEDPADEFSNGDGCSYTVWTRELVSEGESSSCCQTITSQTYQGYASWSGENCHTDPGTGQIQYTRTTTSGTNCCNNDPIIA